MCSVADLAILLFLHQEKDNHGGADTSGIFLRDIPLQWHIQEESHQQE
ncbi:hypothetical protein ECP030526011_0863 [Escherichia coli P0305260.11]|uniref:Uncharacterized protein n=1 Tax=Escherichia coli ISC7 TaxID=1432555 RepID=W1ER97_ECOLX|nr:hypothetical protein ECoL_01486 [Escherichia coli EC4100B]EGW86639.1 hypothetical protein EC30301_2442 [Escherichia coli 3030-1]EMX95936.1 hypothetical protein EC2720900_1048 [Escherichia coli 2720900]EMZ94591.1 hypothetical protein ECP03052601_0710 [Escherichia coli P0305260.1]ENA06960.1 hypothetical protein ECP02994382_0330 [Escherichia coli P0299438.2]ENC35769.1 hypothetical protein ECP02994389_0754 [Escherichia coli P0299438.9]END34860.1 hypothetical protein EC179100_0831 [Escherichia 